MDVIILSSALRDLYGSVAGTHLSALLLKMMTYLSMENILVSLEGITVYTVILVAFCHSLEKLTKKSQKKKATVMEG